MAIAEFDLLFGDCDFSLALFARLSTNIDSFLRATALGMNSGLLNCGN